MCSFDGGYNFMHVVSGGAIVYYPNTGGAYALWFR